MIDFLKYKKIKLLFFELSKMYYFCNVLDNVMDKNILKNIVECDTDDKVVEMQEYILQDTTVYKVTVYYDIKKVLWKYKYKTYIFPFYFETKKNLQRSF